MQLPTLTPAQALFLTSLLPKQYSLQPTTNDLKRPRAPKKLDDSFTSDFSLTPQRKSKRDIISELKETPNKEKEEGRDWGKESAKESVPSLRELYKDEAKQGDREKRENWSTIPQNGNNTSLQRQQAMTTVLLKLKMHKSSWPFRMPVDPASQGVPNYYQVVREPMDLKTMDRKIKNHQYCHQAQFDQDIRKIIANSFAFNTPDTVYYSLTKDFQNYYEQLRGELMNPNRLSSGKKERRGNESYQGNDSKQKTPKKEKKEKEARKTNGEEGTPKERTMMTLSFKERQQILTQIQNLSQRGMSQLVRLLWGQGVGDWQELQLDLVDLSASQFQKLELFLAQK